MTDYESMAMWDLYAQSGNGIGIRSTSGRLVESLHHEQTSEVFLPPAYLGVVRYIGYATAVVVPNTALTFLTSSARASRTSESYELWFCRTIGFRVDRMWPATSRPSSNQSSWRQALQAGFEQRFSMSSPASDSTGR
jgi:hypothetical protein